MINGFPIFLAEGAGTIIWLIIVVIAIVSQITKAARKNQPPAGHPSGGSPSPVDAEDELRRFLESLSGAPQPSRPAAPPPLPIPPPTLRPPASARPSANRIPLSAARPRPPTPPVRPRRTGVQASRPPILPRAPAPATRAQVLKPTVVTLSPTAASARSELTPLDESLVIGAVDAYKEQKPRQSSSASRERLRLAVGADLGSRDLLRKAILLQEVMGKPLALRSPTQAGER